MWNELPLLLSDEHIAVVNKPSGLAVHQGWAKEKTTVVQIVRRQLGDGWSPVHRLDRATSGALLLARDPETVRRLQAQFVAFDVTKNYLALVRGITPDNGLIDHAIAKSKEHEKREARTAFRRLGTFERYSLVQTRPLTGRLHQIRRHLKFISHPLIGDTKYGKGEHNRLFRERFALTRLALHASHLEFRHPYTEGRICCKAPLPEDLAVISTLGWETITNDVITRDAWRVEPETLPLFA
jgi:tRNA pseudouridine65 synthase